MPKVVITCDTEDKTLAVTVDGKKVDNVRDCSIYSYIDYQDDPQIQVNICSHEEVDGMRKMTYLVNATCKEAKELVKNYKAKASKMLEGFVERLDYLSPVQNSIAEFMSKKK